MSIGLLRRRERGAAWRVKCKRLVDGGIQAIPDRVCDAVGLIEQEDMTAAHHVCRQFGISIVKIRLLMTGTIGSLSLASASVGCVTRCGHGTLVPAQRTVVREPLTLVRLEGAHARVRHAAASRPTTSRGRQWSIRRSRG